MNTIKGLQSLANRHGRLTNYQIESIRRAVGEVLDGATARIWLFGSRADEARRGGDIDLFIETNADLPNRAEAICRIYAKIIMALGDRKVDVLLKDGKTPEAPVFLVARQTGIPL